jgi:transposase-like protein/IS1 family transposase
VIAAVQKCEHPRTQRFGKTETGQQRFRCCECRKTFVASTRTLDGMRIGVDKAEKIVRCMTEGVGIRSTARLLDVSKDTVLDVLTLIGKRCIAFLEDAVVGVPVKDVQADEIWSRVYCTEKTRKRLSLPMAMYGDKYCFVGIERHHKLALAWHVGRRDIEDGRAFVIKLACACANHDFQVTTDGWTPYKRLISDYFPCADFAQLLKIYASVRGEGRYSPGQIIDIKLKTIKGSPDMDRVCTSHVERHNLTMRLWNRRLTRLTMGFSRKLLNHEAALGIYFAAYNFVSKHSTLKTTPAVAAGIATAPWSVAELINRTAGYDSLRRTALDRYLETMPEE